VLSKLNSNPVWVKSSIWFYLRLTLFV